LLNLTKWKIVGRGASATILLANLLLEIRELTSGNSLDDVVGHKYWCLLQQHKHFKFTIIEEKRKDLSPKELIDCVPQVTGESLALYVAFYFFNNPDSTLIFDRQRKSRYALVIPRSYVI